MSKRISDADIERIREQIGEFVKDIVKRELDWRFRTSNDNIPDTIRGAMMDIPELNTPIRPTFDLVIAILDYLNLSIIYREREKMSAFKAETKWKPSGKG